MDMTKYSRSICITCRNLADCALSTDMRFITYCCDYEHQKETFTKPVKESGEEDNYEELIFI